MELHDGFRVDCVHWEGKAIGCDSSNFKLRVAVRHLFSLRHEAEFLGAVSTVGFPPCARFYLHNPPVPNSRKVSK